MTKEKLKKLVIIFGIIILPFIYSLFYLGAFWNPYGSLSEIPVALVNEDDCEKNCMGEELIKTLKDDGTFKFEETTNQKAEDGLVNKKYYAIIKIPSNFTENLNSASEENKKQALITYSPNTKTNFLASQILNSAVIKIEKSLESKVSEKIVQNLTDNLNSVPQQTSKIYDALGSINDGTNTLNSGAGNLKNGTNNLKENYNKFNDGLNSAYIGGSGLYTSYKELNDGINNIYTGVNTLKEKTENVSSLVNGSTELNKAIENLSEGETRFNTNNQTALDNAKLVYTYIVNYANSNPEVLNDENFKNIYLIASNYLNGGIDTLKQTSEFIDENLKEVSKKTNLLTQNIKSVESIKSAIDTLDSNLLKIKEGSNKIYVGLEKMNSGLETLNENSLKIKEGVTSLDNGAGELKEGTNTLNNGVSEAKEEVSKKITGTEKELEKTNNLSSYAEDSIKVTEENYGNVTKYGIAFSPYFMSLSLWVGGILILMGLYYDPDHRFKTLGRNTNNRTLRVFLYCLIAIIQAIILGFLLKLLLGFEVTNVFLYYASCILISVTFLSIILFLFVNFKDVGKFLSLVLLVLQLAACGGTFPIETEPKIYQLVYPFMPMTYSLDLLKESFVKVNSSFIIKDVIILLSIWLIFTVLTIVTGIIKTKKANSK